MYISFLIFDYLLSVLVFILLILIFYDIYFINTRESQITTTKNTDVITIVVKMIRSIDSWAPYPLGTRAVKFSLPQADKNSAKEPNTNNALIFPIQPFMYSYLSFSLFSLYI